jgi:TonB-linked SusC/RagA family outer membrane protein
MKKSKNVAYLPHYRQLYAQVFRIMKLAVFLILIGLGSVFADNSYSQNTQLSVHLKNGTIKDLFDQIQKQSEFIFFYKDSQVDLNQSLNIDFENVTIEQILEKVLSNTNLGYKIFDRQIVILPGEKKSAPNTNGNPSILEQQQKKEIKGKVTDPKGGSLPGVSIVVKGTTTGTISDGDGNFTLQVPADAKTLSFSFVGMKSQEVAIAGKTSFNIVLEEETVGIEEVVAVGYGTQSRAQVTSAITSVKGESLAEIPTNTISSVLQGKVSGVRIKTVSGQPGNDLDIQIRGGSSINKSNSPLYIVDGLTRTISDINPQDIETIEVLKDAAATAIYGARASNGVILISTKRGKSGKSDIDFDYTFGVQDFTRKLDLLNSRQWLETFRVPIQQSSYVGGVYDTGRQASGTGNDETSTWTTRFLTDGEAVPAGYESMVDPATGKTIIFQNNIMQDILFRSAPQSTYNLSANGGNDQIKYSAGLGYLDQQGVAYGTSYSRVNGRANVDFNVNQKISLRSTTDFSYSSTNIVGTNDGAQQALFARGAFLAPTIREKFADGTPGYGINATLTNPVYYMDNHYDNSQRTIVSLGLEGTWHIIKDLDFMTRVNYLTNNEMYDGFEKDNQWAHNRPASARRDVYRTLQNEATLSYKKAFNEKHNLTTLIGASRIYFTSDNANLAGNGASSDIRTLNASPNITSGNTFFSDELLISQFARIGYNYDYKYLLSASVRRDGSSVFGLNNKYGTFPSFSAGWVLSNESFYKSIGIENVLSMAKLRASYGLTGNNNLGGDRYAYQGSYNASYVYGGNAGVLATAMPNNSLAWESTTQTNIGADLSFLKEKRINLIFDYFVKTTNDLLFTVELPRETGFNNIQQNVGSVQFKGMEFTLSTININGKDFKWTSDFNIGTLKNKVIKLPFRDGIDKNRINGIVFPDGTGVGGIAEGESLGAIVGYKVKYIIDNQTQADEAAYDELAKGWDPVTKKFNPGKKFPGDIEWIDRDENSRITALDQYVLGYEEPTVTGGLNNSFSYKGFELSLFVDYAFGQTIVDVNRGWINGVGARDINATTDILSAWKQPGDAAKTTQPRVVFHDPQGQQNHVRTSDLYAFKGDYLSIRDVNLSYTFSNDILNKTKFIRSLKIYLAGNNLYYFTAYPGYNPEKGGLNVNTGTLYPTYRTLTFGIKLGL